MKTDNSSNKIFIIVIALLLIANIVTLSMLLSDKKHDSGDDKKNAMRNYLKTEIGFSDAQIIAFDTVKSNHRAQVKKLYDEMRLQKQNNLKEVGNSNFNDSAINKAADYSAKQQEKMETNMLTHLKEIRNLCTAPQRAIFDTGFYKIMLRPNPESKDKK